MSIRFQCPECQKSYEVADVAAGKSAKCKACGATIQVPIVDVSLAPAGTDILRHKKAVPFKAVKEGGKHLAEIEAHIRKYVGEPAFVWHEMVSDKVHLDVHVVKPSEKYPWHTLITSGMSDKPMNAPEGAEDERFAEMVLCLPPEWEVSERGFKSLDNFWPLKWLKQVARLPHDYDTWISVGHTIPNGDPPEPFHASTEACCWFLLPPLWFPDEFSELRLKSGEKIRFLSIVPLYEEEVDYKLQRGTEKLASQLQGVKLTDLMRFDRPNVCAGGFFRRGLFWMRGHRWTTGGAIVLAIAFFYALATGQVRPPALENRNAPPPGVAPRPEIPEPFGGGIVPPAGPPPGPRSIEEIRAEHEKRIEEMRARAQERMDSRDQ
jgi:hypothetical protein